MNARNTFRLMIALASFILLSMLNLAILARMDLVQGIGIQQINETTAASANSGEELGEQFYNLTSMFFH
jgi:hypothetical protein